ncbi:putative papain-like cysteine peptidase superfamily [Helianthus debilis subsp. tardiflorus]
MFTQNLDQWLEQFKVKSIRDFDLLFFPILASEHYYVLCFNLKTSKIVLIDNSKMGEKFHDRYQGIPNMLRNALCDYLELKKIRFAKKTLRKAIIKRLEMPWRTEETTLIVAFIQCAIWKLILVKKTGIAASYQMRNFINLKFLS